MAHSKARELIPAAMLVVALAVTIAIAIRLGSAPSLAPFNDLIMASSRPGTDGLQARYFGVSTLAIQDDRSALMIDGFFSRPGVGRLAFGRLEPDERRIAAAIERSGIDRLDAVLVAHSHHDHALDSAVVARRMGAELVGSESTANIARGQGFDEGRIRVVNKGDSLRFGAFQIEVVESPHTRGILNEGEIQKPLSLPARIWNFKLGRNFAFHIRHPERSILIVPGSNSGPETFRGRAADVVFLGVGSLGRDSDAEIESHWRNVVTQTGARLVIAIHWDDFTRPLDEPLRPLPYIADDLPRTLGVLKRLARAGGVELRLPPLIERFSL